MKVDVFNCLLPRDVFPQAHCESQNYGLLYNKIAMYVQRNFEACLHALVVVEKR